MIRAAVFDGPGRPFRFETLPLRPPGPAEVVVRVTLCTVCGSDLHTVTGRRHGPTPCVLGHEVVGVVEAAGADARDAGGSPLEVGRRVVVGVAASCGGCFYCTRGLPQKCESLAKLGHAAAVPDRGPFGGLASHCHLPAGAVLVPLPDDLPDEVAAPAGCAAATAAAALRTAGPAADCVVVFGAGMLGLTACAMAAAGGAGTVIACDVDAGRLAIAQTFGATHTVCPTDDGTDLPARVRELSHGRGADAALELSGSPAAAEAAVGVLRTGGVAVWAGGVFPTPPVALTPERVVRGCLTIAGVHNYTPADLRTAVAFLAAHHARYPFAGLVEANYPLSAVEEAFATALSSRPVRVGVRPSP